MSDRLDEMIQDLQREVQTHIDAGHTRRGARAHEQLVPCQVARLISQREGHPAVDILRPDAQAQRGVDLCFRCGEKVFAVEHTFIETWEGQRRRIVTRKTHPAHPLPRNLEELPERRERRMRRALADKLPKLARWKERLRAEHGTCDSVLVLEDEDFVYSHASLVADTLVSLLREFPAQEPDEIHLVQTQYLVSTPEAFASEQGAPNTADLFALKYGSSIARRRGDTSRPAHTHPVGPYRWDPDERNWGLAEVPARRA